MLKADSFILIPTREKAILSYNQKDKRLRDFINYCESTYNSATPIGPYPILHQLYHGRLVIKNKSFEKSLWPELLDEAQVASRSPTILAPFTMIYLESC